jgi:restriction system protein
MTYWRINLGEKGKFAQEAFEGGWIGTGWAGDRDLSEPIRQTREDFSQWFIALLMSSGNSNKRAAAIGSSATWWVGNGLELGDIVFTRKLDGNFQSGRVTGDYFYQPGHELPHRRPVEWFPHTIYRTDVSPQVKATFGSMRTVCHMTGYAPEIQALYDAELSALADGRVLASSPEVIALEENASFLLEKYLEEFLVGNWGKTLLGATYNLIDNQVDTEVVGRIDILAESKDKKTLVVVELKLGRTSDTVVGQVQRYMGWVQEHYAEPGQTVRGIIIGSEDDARIRYALKVAPNIELMRYAMDFRLESI